MRSLLRRSRVIGGLAIVVGVLLGASSMAMSPATAAAPLPAPACPSNWTCTSMPSGGGQVQLGPTQHVTPLAGTQPWVFVRLYGFAPGSEVTIHYCSLVQALASQPPVCVTQGGNFFVRSPTMTLRTFDDGSSASSFQVPLDDPSSGTPLVGNVPGQSTQQSFYCDGGSLSCGVVVTDSALAKPYSQTPTVHNSIALPINFDLTGVACPSKQTLLPSEAEYGIGPLLPVVDRINCASKAAPVNLFNTEQNGVRAVHDLYENVRSNSSSAIRVAFTDDPEAPDQQKYLPKGHFVLIPVALTANTMAVEAQMQYAGISYPQQNIALSANMTAGILSGYYQNPYSGTDSYPCAGTCPTPPCYNTTQCSLFVQLNNVPGFFSAKQYGSFPRADQAGTTDQVLQWICNAPAASVPVGGVPVPEADTGSQTLLKGLSAGGHPFPACPITDQWPAETLSSQFWSAGISPQDQLKALSAAVPGVGPASSPVNGFATMNWAWTNYLGLDTSALQNAAGAFVAPSASSLDAAITDAAQNGDGTYTPSYANTTDAAAYPMPSVIYAAVSTDTMPAAQKANIQAALTSVLDVTGGSQLAQLPPGYVPLTAELYTQATTEVAQAVGNPSFDINSILTHPIQSSTGTGSSNGSFTPTTYRGSNLGTGIFGASAAAGTGGSGKNAPYIVPWSSPLYAPFELAVNSSRMMLSWIVMIGAGATLLGAVLLLWGSLRSAATALFSRVPAEGAEPGVESLDDVPEDL